MLRHLFIISVCIFCAYTFASCSDPAPPCFTWSPVNITTQTTVEFNASCIEKASVFRWDFGDGTSPIITTSLTTQHSYLTPGSYTVTVTGKPFITNLTDNREITRTRVITVK